MLHQTFLFLGQLWQLFEVSQILEFLRYVATDMGLHCLPMTLYGFPGKNGLKERLSSSAARGGLIHWSE